MSWWDGGVYGVTKIHHAGPANRRFNLTILSEGYRAEELGQFAADAALFVTRLFQTPPFDDLACAINVYRIDVWSVDSGADDPYVPPDCIGTGATPRTFFDATFCGYGVERLILTNSPLVEYVIGTWLPASHAEVILVNSKKEGGNGDKYATVSKGNGWDWPKVVIHELGHSVFQLGDEYDFLTACDDGNTVYQGTEPEWPNVAMDVTREGLKWTDRVDPPTPLPTFSNPDCATCYKGATGFPDKTVGAFEGAGLYHCNLYRPQPDCLMRYSDEFCVVCGSVIRAYMDVFTPTCLAPTFAPASNAFVCWIRKLFLALVVLLLSLASWYPAVRCTYKRLLFRIQYCDVGNEDPCIDLDAP